VNDSAAIETTDLTRSFIDNPAVDHLNLRIRKGELFGLVGPDGAGKTTTMRLLAAILEPSAGDATVAGHSIRNDAESVKEKIGYMPQRFGLYEDLTVMENILFYADLYGVSRRERPPRIERLLGFSNLAPFKDRLAGKLSGGMKQKLGLACALVHTPEVLLLDEPTNGVDPVSRRDFWKILYGLLKEGITIFVSTAYLDEAERCMRVGLMHKGRIMMLDEPSAIKRSLPGSMIEFGARNARAAAGIVRAAPGVRSVSVYGDRLHVLLDDRAQAGHVRNALDVAGVGVLSEREILPSLEDVFISMVGK